MITPQDHVINQKIKFILFLKMKTVNHLADKITFPSEYLRKFYVKYGSEDKKTITIYNFMQFPKTNKSRINHIKKNLKKQKMNFWKHWN